jgi:hypothetical protein
MRKTGIIFVLALFAAARTFAQTSIELIPTVGYTFADRTDYYNTYGRVDGGLSLGGSVKFNINRSTGIEILYSHMNTQTGLYPYGYSGDNNKLAGGNLSFDYIMLGAVQSFGIPNSTVRPFIGGFLGAAILSPGDESGSSSDAKFAIGVQLGTNIYFTPQLGLQLKAQLLAPTEVLSSGLYFSNYGAGGGISSYSDIYQFSLSAGLIIGLGRVLPEQTYRRTRPGPRHYRYYY